MTEIRFDPKLPLSNLSDPDLIELDLAFSSHLPWITAVLSELQTGRDLTDHEFEELPKVIY